MTLSLQTINKHKPPRILIYGTAGIGKSTFGAMAPDPVFIQTEDGLDAINVAHYPLANTYQEVMGYLSELCTEPHDYKTLVIDSVDWFERILQAQLCGERNVKSISDIPYGKGYEIALDLWREYISALNYLRDNRGMMIIQIAHADIKRFENPETEGYDRYQIKLHQKASALLDEHSDIVLFANHVVSVRKKQDGFKETVKAIGSGQRVLHTEERPAFKAKNRYSLPAEIPFDKDGAYWTELVQHIPYYNKGE